MLIALTLGVVLPFAASIAETTAALEGNWGAITLEYRGFKLERTAAGWPRIEVKGRAMTLIRGTEAADRVQGTWDIAAVLGKQCGFRWTVKDGSHTQVIPILMRRIDADTVQTCVPQGPDPLPWPTGFEALKDSHQMHITYKRLKE